MTVALIVGAIVFISCQSKIETASDINVADIPTEEIKNMKVLYTENGIIKYDFEAVDVKHYQQADTPYYHFPSGIYGRSFITDSVNFAIANAEIIGDEAYFREKPEFYEIYQNVVARNLLINQRIETDTMYYDPSKSEKAIYSYSSSVIIRPPDTIPALDGFYTDNQFRLYELIKIRKGTVYFSMETDSTRTDTTRTTGISAPLTPTPSTAINHSESEPEQPVPDKEPALERIQSEEKVRQIEKQVD